MSQVTKAGVRVVTKPAEEHPSERLRAALPDHRGGTEDGSGLPNEA